MPKGEQFAVNRWTENVISSRKRTTEGGTISRKSMDRQRNI